YDGVSGNLQASVNSTTPAVAFDAGNHSVTVSVPKADIGDPVMIDARLSVSTADVTDYAGYDNTFDPIWRTAGADRVGTAIENSTNEFAAQQADAVVLAQSTNFPDAIAGTPLAADKNAPMLLTPSTGLDSRVADEIERVLAPGGDVYILGGTAALSATV